MVRKVAALVVLLFFVWHCVSASEEFNASAQRSRMQSVWADKAAQKQVVHLEKNEILKQVHLDCIAY